MTYEKKNENTGRISKKTLDYAFARGIRGKVKVLPNPKLSDHHALRIQLEPAPSGRFTVLSFNTHFGTDTEEVARNPSEYAAFIKGFDPEVVCMQEIDKGPTCKTKSVDQGRAICTALATRYGIKFHKHFYSVRQLKRTGIGKYDSYEKEWGGN